MLLSICLCDEEKKKTINFSEKKFYIEIFNRKIDFKIIINQ